MANPLHALHQQAEADFQPYGDIPVVSTFGEPQAEYAAIRKGAALIDRPHRGVLELTGRDRLPFLNNLLTNETWNKDRKAPMPAGSAIYAFFLNVKGRIAADMNVIELGDRTLIEMDARLVEPMSKSFDRYLFSEQVKLTPRSDTLHQFLLTGPAALGALRQAASGAEVPDLAPMQAAQIRVASHGIAILRDDITGVPSYTLIFPTESAEPLWTLLSSSPHADPTQFLRHTGLARPTGWAAFNSTRIEAGRPLYGVDFDDSVLPAETGPQTFARGVSLTKGCYLGQEIVARMHARGQIARQLVGIRVSADALPTAGAKLYDESQSEIGGITSSTLSPVLSNAPICLGYVKKGYFGEGTKLVVPAEGAMRPAAVAVLPFLK
jgi:aminomethyltransferase